jgi:ABC-type multidrug transport system fused ATPase/permease subunit
MRTGNFADGAWEVLLGLVRPYARQLGIIAVLALLSTAAELLQPFIYRTAINDVAGLFVEGLTDVPEVDAVAVAPPSLPPRFVEVQAPKKSGKKGSKQAAPPTAVAPVPPPRPAPHRPDFVASRTPQQALSGLWWAVALLFFANLAGYYLSLLSENRSVALAGKIEADLIRSTFGHVLHLPLSFFSRKSTGALSKQIDQSDQVAPIVSAFSQQIAPEVLRTVGIVAIMLIQSWRLALVALATLPLYIWISRLAAKRLESGMEQYFQMWEGVSARIHDALAAIKTVKLSGAEEREEARFQKSAKTAYDDYAARTRLANRYLFLQAILSHLSRAGVLGYGGWLVLERRLTPGDVVMFYVYLDRLFNPIDSLSSIAVGLQEHFVSLNRAVRLLKTGGSEHRGAELAAGPGAVELRDVHFGYRAGREVLHGVTLKVAPGKTTALVGPSGAGKTTIADLLLKLYEPSSGEIILDGQDLSKVDPLSLRRQIGVVAADGAVFRGTLADNIRYKRPDAPEEDVRAAAESAGLGRMIESLPDGLQTEVGESGVGLSLGERQRLQMARILVGRPRLLILDEATANLDYATESDIKNALLSLPYHPTTLVIAHRYSMVRDADWVIVIEDGQIVEEGKPSALRTSGGWFSQLADQSEASTLN